MAFQCPEGRSYTTSLQCQFHNLLVCYIRPVPGRKTKAHRGRKANENCVVPGKLGQRLGQFLEPAVVGESSIENCWIGTEYDFNFVLDIAIPQSARRTHPIVSQGHRFD